MPRDEWEKRTGGVLWCGRRAGGRWLEPVGEVGHGLFNGDPVGVVFQCFDFSAEGGCVVRRDLDGTVVDFAEGVHVLLSCHCRTGMAECRMVGFVDVVTSGWCRVQMTAGLGC